MGRTVTITAAQALAAMGKVQDNPIEPPIDHAFESECSILREAIDQAEHIAEDHGWQALGVSHMKPLLKGLPPFLEASKYYFIDDGLNLKEYREELEATCYEFNNIRRKPIHFIWQVSPPKQNGVLVLGKARLLPKQTASLWKTGDGPVPYWEIKLSLPNWLLASRMQRLSLLHHEMMHCGWVNDKPTIKPHDIQDHAKTLERFGTLFPEEAVAIAAGAAHPRMQEPDVKRWLQGPGGQLLLFHPYQPGDVDRNL
jgi:hypothetical protein